MSLSHLEVVLKPTFQCNAQCEYCNVPQVSGRMELRVLDALFRGIGSIMDKDPDCGVTILWHGGEPLVMGERFYERAARQAQSILAGAAAHIMQTNLTLATDGIVSVLEELLTDSGLGTSLEPFQDYRKLKDGASYMERWYEGFEHVKSRGFRVGMVYVVHGRSIDRVRDLYYYFKNLGLDSLTVIPLEKPAGAFRGEGLDPPAWGRFLVELFKVWRADGRSFPVQPFYGWEEMLDVSSSPSCDQLVSCSEPMMAVSPNGDIYPCVRRADMRVGKVGNILSDSIEQLLSHPDSKWRSLRRELITEGSCGTCKWWRFCAGGCAAASGYRQKTKWCQGYRIFFEAFDER